MITNLKRAAFLLLPLALSPLALPSPTSAAPTAAEVLPLSAAIEQLPVAGESRAGYNRSAFRHWNSGLDATDGCHTRNEVLLAEAIEPPTVAAGCKLAGGRWLSYYDGQEVTDPAGLDIDHMVPLAEAWDSGASGWDAQRRGAFANDQGADASLVAVTARTNRSKADQDPYEWMPPASDATCRYLAEWTATKLRWQLTADRAEKDTLDSRAADCGSTVVAYTPAP